MGGWEGVSGPKLVWVSWVGDFLCSNGVGFLGSHLYFFFCLSAKKKESLSIYC